MDEHSHKRAFLAGKVVPPVLMQATNGQSYDLSKLRGTSVVFCYPRTSPPNAAPIEGWDKIPGARGCTPQSCGFRDHYAELRATNVQHVFGLSTQGTDYQAEVVERLKLPFPLLSDADLAFSHALTLDLFEAGGMVLIKRISLIIRNGFIKHVMYPVGEPDQNAADIIAYLNRSGLAK